MTARNKLPADHHAETIEAFASSAEAMSASEQAMFWRCLAEDAIRTLTVERDTYQGLVPRSVADNLADALRGALSDSHLRHQRALDVLAEYRAVYQREETTP